MTNPKPETHLSKSSNDSRTVGPVTQASTTGAALGVVLSYLFTLAGLEVPEYVTLALVTLLSIAGGWLVKPGSGARRK